MKFCKHCNTHKEKTEFYVHKKGKQLRVECKKCSYIINARYYADNPDKKRLYQHNKSIKQRPYILHKKDICEKLHFSPEHSGQLDVDHIDGNHSNNDVNNLQTLCANCHRLKTIRNRDNIKIK